MNRIVFTCGDINGIGPEICLKTIQKIYNPKKNKIYLSIPAVIFNHYSNQLKFNYPLEIKKSASSFSIKPEIISILDLGSAKLNLGKPTKTSGRISFNSIKSAYEIINNGYAEAMVTAPISKTAFNLADINFPGHTELLAEWDKCSNFVMTFISKKMKCALITIHDPIHSVSKKINITKIKSVIKTVVKSLENDFKILNPKIAVLGLNPHAGENGKIGTEEIKIIKPAINSMANSNISGPFVPDAFFANKFYLDYDIIIGMYHDQVLIPFKMMNFNTGVNYTAGLSFIRTSPDHGTAFDIAGKNIADPSSMIEAVNAASLIIKNRKRI